MAEDIKADLKKQELPKENVLTDKYKSPAPTKQPKETRKYDTSFPHTHGLATEEHKKALGKLEEKK